MKPEGGQTDSFAKTFQKAGPADPCASVPLWSGLLFPAVHAVPADLEPRNQNVKLAVALDLSLHAVKQVALEFLHFAAS